jgi:hypothetical protein
MTLADRAIVACMWILIANIRVFGNIYGSHPFCLLLNKLYLFSLARHRFILIQIVAITCKLSVTKGHHVSGASHRPFVLCSRPQKSNLSHRHGGWMTLSWLRLRNVMNFTVPRTRLAHKLCIYLFFYLFIMHFNTSRPCGNYIYHQI